MSAPSFEPASTETIEQLIRGVRDRFLDISTKADRDYVKHWGETPNVAGAYSWFQSLANALNAEMQRQTSYSVYEPLFHFIDNALVNCTKAVFDCIDVSFVENLFWQVSETKAQPYWHPMPDRLKQLYVGFHGSPPAKSSE